MLQEYALDPELLTDWRSVRYYLEKFSYEQARLIAKLPSRWKRSVYEALGAAGLGDVEKKRIEVYLQNCLDERILVPRPGHNWESSSSWLDNVLSEHQRLPLDGIVAHENPGKASDVILGEDLDESLPEMRSPTAVEVERIGVEIVKPLCKALLLAKEVVFVDPYLAATARKGRASGHFNPLEEFLEAVWNPERNRAITRIEYHTEIVDSEDLKRLQHRCEQALPTLIPQNTDFTVVGWREKQLHDRFVITDLCTFDCGHGLDEGDDNRKLLIKIISDRDMHEALFRKYRSENGYVSFKVSGSRRI